VDFPGPGRADGANEDTVADCDACFAGDHRCGPTAASAPSTGICDADGCAGGWMLRICQRHDLRQRDARRHLHLDTDGDVSGTGSSALTHSIKMTLVVN
jgi:hypothetical protein